MINEFNSKKRGKLLTLLASQTAQKREIIVVKLEIQVETFQYMGISMYLF